MQRLKVYLSGRYSRHPELAQYRKELEDMGIIVTSRWVLGDHEYTDESPEEFSQRLATEDMNDLLESEIFVAFSETPRSTEEKASRGGRHVEFGMALVSGKRIILVGPYENVFHHLPIVTRFEDWGTAREYFRRRAGFRKELLSVPEMEVLL